MPLILDDNFKGRGDDAYEALLDAHRDLSDAKGAALDARLVLVLANHIGDLDVLRGALALARSTLDKDDKDTDQEAPP